MGPKRFYDKNQRCLYCRKSVKKIARHLLSQHDNETEVAELIALKGQNDKISNEKYKANLTLLRNRGNFMNNLQIIKEGGGDIAVLRRPHPDMKRNKDDYVPCTACLGFFLADSLHKHNKLCPILKNNKQTLRDCRFLLETSVMDDRPSNVS